MSVKKMIKIKVSLLKSGMFIIFFAISAIPTVIIGLAFFNLVSHYGGSIVTIYVLTSLILITYFFLSWYVSGLFEEKRYRAVFLWALILILPVILLVLFW
jgi:ABC-type uncharacterized transport system permease subunit